MPYGPVVTPGPDEGVPVDLPERHRPDRAGVAGEGAPNGAGSAAGDALCGRAESGRGFSGAVPHRGRLPSRVTGASKAVGRSAGSLDRAAATRSRRGRGSGLVPGWWFSTRWMMAAGARRPPGLKTCTPVAAHGMVALQANMSVCGPIVPDRNCSGAMQTGCRSGCRHRR